MRGVFDFVSLTWLVLGVIILLMGVNNYNSSKEKFDVRYFRYAIGISFLLLVLVKYFIGFTSRGIKIAIIAVIIIFIVECLLSYIVSKNHN